MERLCRCPKCGFLVDRQGATTPDARAALVIKVEKHLVGRERMLLGLMMRRFGRVVTHDDLIVTMWPNGIEPDAISANMRVRISHIRRAIKLVGAPWAIRSEFALGYRLYEIDPPKKEV